MTDYIENCSTRYIENYAIYAKITKENKLVV